LNNEHEAKLEKFWHSSSANNLSLNKCRVVYEYITAQNGINTEEPVKEQPFSDLTLGTPRIWKDKTYPAAPEWVIEMMMTGKSVRCKCWDDCKGHASYEDITGYDLSSNYPFIGENQGWKHAEPTPEWDPKDGENVLWNNAGTSTLGYYEKGKVWNDTVYRPVGTLLLKPFSGDVADIGKPWI